MIYDLYKKLKRLKVSIREIDGRLDIQAAKGILSDTLLEEIRSQKEELIKLINLNKKGKNGYDPIPRAPIQPDYPLSSSQRRLWLLSQIEEGSIAYNIPGIYEFEGNLDYKSLEYAITKLISRHEILRTVFIESATGEVRQSILAPESTKIGITFSDLRSANAQSLKDLTERDFARPFDLAAGPLLRNGVYRISDDKYIFTYTVHHIICDGISMDVLIRELLLIYNGYIGGEEHILEPLDVQYKDYAVWQQKRLQGNALQLHKNYWLSRFEGDLPVLDLPGDRPRPLVRTHKGAMLRTTLSKDIGRNLKALVREEGATLFMGLLAAVKVLLYRYTGQTDIIVGSQIAEREHADLENQIGLYLNALALRSRFKDEDSYRELLKNIKGMTLGAYEHQAYPFDEMVEALDLQRDRSRNVLFDVSVVLQNSEARIDGKHNLGGVSIRAYGGRESLISKFDLAFDFTDTGDDIQMSLIYNSDIYNRGTASRLTEHLGNLLEVIISDPDAPICELEFLDEGSKRLQLVEFNDTSINYPDDGTVADLFAAQVEKTPDRIAVVFSGCLLTYTDLDEKSNRLACYLRREHDILPNDLIGVMLDRSERTIIAILGILKAGGAYVPIDPEYPRSRKEFIMRDTRITVLITQSDYIFDLDYYTGVIFAIDIQLDTIDPGEKLPAGINKPQDLAYVMYTSGSTGRPKGVMIPHAGIIRLVRSPNFITLTGTETLLSTGAVSFDATSFEYWGMLLNGGKLVMCSQETLLDTARLGEEIRRCQVDTMWFTASWLNHLVDTDIGLFRGLKTVLAGGDKLSPAHIDALHLQYPDMQIINGYGPTENTTFSLCCRVETSGAIMPIGKPLNNSTVYIMRRVGELLPLGMVGEICVGGAGLARGYLNNAGLTAEKFVSDPFRKRERIYRTGDLGRWLPDGNIAFVGRLDDQVKIRGYRVELGEIESWLKNMTDIDDSAVMARKDERGDTSLIAYLVARDTLNVSVLRDKLAECLPDYMIPSYYVQLEKLPLTENGKLDKKVLPDPESAGMARNTEYVAPHTAEEKGLVKIWEEILGKDAIGIRDNFFELGGDSIKILRMISEARKKIDLKIPVALVYQYNTIESIIARTLQNEKETSGTAQLLAENRAVAEKEIEDLKSRILSSVSFPDRDNVEDIYPMSDIEKGMSFGSLLNEGLSVYHDQFFFRRWFTDFDIDRFRLAMELLADRHSILRTGFNISDYETEVQIVYKNITFPIEYNDLSAVPADEQQKAIRQYMGQELKKTFRVSLPPLWRMSVFKEGQDSFGFVWQFHHAILDGWSNASFITELNNLYLKLGEDPTYRSEKLRSDYKDFIIRQTIDRKDDILKDFWCSELAGYTRLDLFGGDDTLKKYSADLGSVFLKKIERAAVENGTTVKAISLSAWLYMLKLLNYGSEIVTGLVTNTRPDSEDSDKVIGCFLNTIPLRMEVREEEKCAGFVNRTNNKLIALKPYERLSLPVIALVNKETRTAGNPFFDVLFNFVDFHVYKEIENGPATKKKSISPEGSVRRTEADLLAGRERTNTWLDLSVSITGGSYHANFTAAKKLKSGLPVARLGDLYIKILTFLVDFPQRSLYEMELLQPEEKFRLLEEFNDTSKDYPHGKTLVDLFEEQVSRTPGKIALVFEGSVFTYGDLNKRANRLGDYLRRKFAIRPDDLVGIMSGHNEWMIIAILGALKAGAAYMPIDPAYPQERIDYMITDSNCKAVLDQQELQKFREEEANYTDRNPDRNGTPADLAYVIYTSGSTGKPKGCMLQHRGAVNRICWMLEHYKFDEEDIILQKTNFTFDVSVWELFIPLCFGIKMVLCKKEDARSPERILTLIDDQKITCLHFVPGMLSAFIAAAFGQGAAVKGLESLRRVITSGEALPLEVVKSWYDKSDVPIHNLYGPTEASVDVTYYATSKNDVRIPIGRPIWNTRMYILGSRGQLMPIGITGEICIAGDGLARGYLNKPDLTAEKFVANPFRKGERMYKTGDLGRWLPDGNIEFIGRKDDQVKIRGYRIELGEIENTLQGYAGIDASVVIARSAKDSETELAAYLVSREALNVSDIRAYLSKTLPAYMLPAHFIQLESLPLTSSGKTDRRRLPEPEGNGMVAGTEYVPPRNEMEERLVLIWQEVLGKETIGVKDNFFESGGHSLKATRLASRIKKEFDTDIALNEIFLKVTPEEQVQLILQAAKKTFDVIPVAASQPSYPLSSSQYRLWMLSQFEEANIAYNMPGVYSLEGELDVSALERSFIDLIERHESLRTVFGEESRGEVRQSIRSSGMTGFNMTFSDLCDQPEKHQKLRDLVRLQSCMPFDLSAGPLVRAGLFRIAEDKWIFIYVIHHIVSDGWSGDLLIKELLLLYNSRRKGIASPLLPLRIHYKDYAVWQQEQLKTGLLHKHKEYWLEQLAGELPVLNVAGDKTRPAVKTYNGSEVKKMLSLELLEGMKAVCQELEGTLFMGLLSVVNALLYRYTSQTDIVLGSPISGREHIDLEEQAGIYINTLVLRTKLQGDDSFRKMMENVRQVTLGAYRHQAYPFDELVRDLHLPRDMSRNALFDIMVTLRSNTSGDGGTPEEPAGLKISRYREVESLISRFDLVFHFAEIGEELQLTIEYNTDIYYKSTIERMAGHLERLMAAVLAGPSVPLPQLDFLGESEKHQLLSVFNDTAAAYPEDRTTIRLFEEQVSRTPGNMALSSGMTSLTYRELNERANQLGDYLRRNYQIRPGDLAGIKLERGEWFIVSILGILKSGAAYLPIDPMYPAERIGYMLEDSKCRILIDEKELQKFQAVKDLCDRENLQPVNGPDDLAYVIYTSGSSGKPKGVMVEYRALNNLCFWHKAHFSVTEEDHATLYAGVAFDAAVWELFPYIITGACLYIIPADIRTDIGALAAFYEANKISISFLPTQVGEQFLEMESRSLRCLLIGGDKLNAFTRKGFRVVNNYGPTENTVVATSCTVNDYHSNISIGKPISNVRIYILDDLLQLSPIGVTGEIYIGGDGMARGYFNNPELTAEKFINNPFEKGKCLYKTGDLGRWSADGSIGFMGRKDDQVKIRGYRVELGEISGVLQNYEGIDSADVLAALSPKGEKELVAYIVSHGAINVPELRTWLKERLPAYMVPAHYIQLAGLPLTPNGKIDRRKLPDPWKMNVADVAAYMAPDDETTAKLALIWEDLLGRSKIGIYDHFFDLGGHSLKTTHLAGAIHKLFGVRLTLKQLFTDPVLLDQARLIRQARKRTFTALSPIPLQSHYALSSSQRLFWIACQFEEANIAYNIPAVCLFEKKLDPLSLEYSFNALIERHESLRTVFRKGENGEVRQFILSPQNAGTGMVHLDLRHEKEEIVKSIISTEFVRPFDLEAGPLVRSTLLRIEDSKWIFVYVMHHIAGDGRSMAILTKELLLLYNAHTRGEPNPLSPLSIQYKDYAAWQQEQMSGERLKEHKTYWLSQFEREPSVLLLPTDKTRPGVKTYNGGLIHKTMDSRLVGDLKMLIRQQGGTLFMGLLAAVNALLYKYTGQTDIVIGTSIAGREHPDLEDQIGYYMNTLALRTRFKEEDSYTGLLEKVRKVTLDAYEHQIYPFEDLVDALQLQRDISRNNLFDVLVVMRNADFSEKEGGLSDLGDIEISGYEGIEHRVSKFDLTFSFGEIGENIRMDIEYNSDLFYNSSVVRIAENMLQLLQAIISHPSLSIRQLDHLSQEERSKSLTEFNGRINEFSSAISTEF